MSVKLTNTHDGWGWINISLHWLSALMVFGLYALGWYMVDLDYYDPWYQTGPFWHKSIGLLFFAFLVVRFLNRCLSVTPAELPSHKVWEKTTSSLVHLLLYLLMVSVVVSGYFISTADGDGISFFGLFEIPAMWDEIDDDDDLAGQIHTYATDGLVVLALLHAAAALKHHLIDRDATLLRMLGCKRKS